ncbi:MAG: CHASE2 domain-containing protein, partial [Bacteriovoracaceae bacterium]
MKDKLWLIQIPTIIIFTLLYLILHWGLQGDLKSIFLRDKVYPLLTGVSGKFTDMKFKIRGEKAPKNKVVVLAIDSDSIEQVGRWPWRRDYIAFLIQNLFELGAKTVGLDIVFSEEDERIPKDIKEILRENGLNDLIKEHETDIALQNIIKTYSKNLILGWTTEKTCQPLYDHVCKQYVGTPEVLETIPPIMPAFSFSHQKGLKNLNIKNTPLYSILFPIANIDNFNNYATHAGIFNVLQDYDGTVRKTNLAFLMNKRFYPTLALEMARVALDDELKIVIGNENTIDEISFSKSKKKLDISKQGLMEINFRGGGMTFPYVSALDILDNEKTTFRTLNSPKIHNKKDFFKDAHVIIGVTALGVYDVRSYPFEENVAGVEGHANILDNLLSGDYLRPATDKNRLYFTIFLMVFLALFFSFILTKLTSRPGFALFFGIMAVIGYIDIEFFFNNNLNWISCFLFFELNWIYFSQSIIRYFLEEKDKKFLKEAFGNYISPELIDIMYETGEKPHLGGQEQLLTAYFTDIQSFSSFSEKLTPSELVDLLNEYLTVMTDILLEEGGTLDKYEGDAIIAFFGAPMTFEDHANRAVRVAVKMQKGLLELRKKWTAEGDKWPDVVKDMRMRIGINS